MDELEKLYNELPYFDKQRFLARHLNDARMKDIDDALEDGLHISYSSLSWDEQNELKSEALEYCDDDDLVEELVARHYIVTKDK